MQVAAVERIHLRASFEAKQTIEQALDSPPPPTQAMRDLMAGKRI